jgi:hypothetical protein
MAGAAADRRASLAGAAFAAEPGVAEATTKGQLGQVVPAVGLRSLAALVRPAERLAAADAHCAAARVSDDIVTLR